MFGNDLAEDFIEGDRDGPVRVVGFKFGEVGDIADVVADAVLVHIVPVELFAGKLLDFGDGFEDGDAILAAAAEVIDFTRAGIVREFLDGADDVTAMDIVADLFGFVAEDGVGAAGQSDFDEIGEEAVEFDGGMGGTGQTATAENSDLHSEVAAVFLGHQVRGGLRSTEERMQRAVDAAIFADAVIVLGPSIFPAGFELLERKFVGRIAINFVSAEIDEDGLWTMKTCNLKQIHGPESIHLKIEDRDVARLVVGRLGGAVNNEIEGMGAENSLHCNPVANVEVVVREIFRGAAQAVKVPGGVSLLTEEHGAHVIVDTVDLMSLLVEMFHGL